MWEIVKLIKGEFLGRVSTGHLIETRSVKPRLKPKMRLSGRFSFKGAEQPSVELLLLRRPVTQSNDGVNALNV